VTGKISKALIFRSKKGDNKKNLCFFGAVVWRYQRGLLCSNVHACARAEEGDGPSRNNGEKGKKPKD